MQLRRATADDVPHIERVMRESIVGISNRTYDVQQVESSLKYVARLDRELVSDGTYFVVEHEGEIVGCGGWSKRGRLYAGSGSADGDARMLDPATEPARIRAMFVVPRFERRGIGRMILEACEAEARAAGFRELELMAMLSGHAMYLATGYRDVETVEGKLEDGTPYPLIRMRKLLSWGHI
jgi:N-acetylglutamate synthase-like GNAT family acetyltransferase